MFWRVLRAEVLKLRRTIALRMALLAPLVVVFLMLFIASQMPLSILRRPGIENDWVALSRMNFVFWGLLMLPMYITLETALIAGVDHAESQWKALLARPVPRYAFYLAKLTVIAGLILFSTGLLVAGVMGSGLLLPHLQSEATFRTPIPAGEITRQGFQMTALSFLALSIQHWIGLRWRAFAVPTGAGIVAMVLGYGMVAASQPGGGWPQWFPWSLPMLVLARWPVDIGSVLAGTLLFALLVTVAGCVEFTRREVN